MSYPDTITHNYLGKDGSRYVDYIRKINGGLFSMYKDVNGKLIPANGIVELPFGVVYCVDGWFHKECGYAFVSNDGSASGYHLDGQSYEEKEYYAELLRRGKERNDEAVVKWCMAKTLGSNNEP